MKILLATDSSKINEFFAVKFVNEGIEPYKTIDVDEIVPIVEEKDIDVLIIDLDSRHYNSYSTIKEIRTMFNKVSIILLTNKTGMDFAKRLLELGVYGFVNKLDDIETQFKNTMGLLENLPYRHKEKRTHMRVKPAPYQHNSFVLKVPGLKDTYVGMVRDISLGGVAATLEVPSSDAILFKGKEVEVDIELGFINIKSKAVVILKKGRDIALLFKDLKESLKKRISEYIISRLG